MSFILSLILGPILGARFEVSGLFWITALLALCADLVVLFVVPTPAKTSVHRDAEPVPAMMGRVVRDSGLLRLDIGVFVLHMTLTAVFLVVPLHLRDNFALDAQHHWMLYLPVMLLAMGLMVPFIIMAERHRQMKGAMLGGIVVLGVALLFMGLAPLGLYSFAMALVLFFAAFNLLEALMPSWVSKVAEAELRGSAMGVFASSQFAGAFCGGLFGGWFHHHFGWNGVFLFAVGMVTVWLLVATGLKAPRHLGNFLVPLTMDELADEAGTEKRLLAVDGVASVHIIVEDAMAYLKVDNAKFDGALFQRIQQPDMPEPA
jgi:MFS family permease